MISYEIYRLDWGGSYVGKESAPFTVPNLAEKYGHGEYRILKRDNGRIVADFYQKIGLIGKRMIASQPAEVEA